MKISSTKYPVFSRYYLSTIARSRNQKKKLLILLLQHIKNNVIFRKPYSEIEEAIKLTRREFRYMIDLLKSLKTPPFLDRARLLNKTQQYFKNNKDPSYFLIPLLEFCIWYNLFIYDIPPSKLIERTWSHWIHIFRSIDRSARKQHRSICLIERSDIIFLVNTIDRSRYQ